jgi:Mrp family chromosome partitioning ATPase
VLVACWSVKGGVGTTVVAAALAVQLARDGAPGVVLADLAGDLPAVLGLAEPESPGLAGWLAAGPGVPADALARIEVDAAPGLALLPRGDGPLRADRAAVLAAVLERSPRTTVVDCGRAVDRGRAEGAVAGAVIKRAQRSLLVTRPCFVALRRVALAPHRPTAVVVVNEPGRVLCGDDVEQLVRAPVTQIEIDPAVARLVDTGLLTGRIPRSLHPLRDAA